MATMEDFKKIAEETAKKTGLQYEAIHPQVYSFMTLTKTQVFRLIFHEMDGIIGVSFHGATYPSDAIQLFDYIRAMHRDVALSDCYYVSLAGETFFGLDAFIMMEQDRQVTQQKKTLSDEDAMKLEEWQIKQAEKSGKITFH